MSQNLQLDVFDIARLIVFYKELLVFIFEVDVAASKDKQVNVRKYVK